MAIAPIGAYSAQPYVYNVNSLSRSSMNKISGIPEDAVMSQKLNVEVSEEENQNPLKRGETKNFADIMMQQMSQGIQNATRAFVSAPEQEAKQQAEESAQTMKSEPTLFRMQNAAAAYMANMA